MSAKRLNEISKELFMYVFILFILLLTAANINNFLKPKTKVLGIETHNTSDIEFWEDFLKNHPRYIPGWVEIERLDKVKEIDPNWKSDTPE